MKHSSNFKLSGTEYVKIPSKLQLKQPWDSVIYFEQLKETGNAFRECTSAIFSLLPFSIGLMMMAVVVGGGGGGGGRGKK